jgi:hypothetical protein
VVDAESVRNSICSGSMKVHKQIAKYGSCRVFFCDVTDKVWIVNKDSANVSQNLHVDKNEVIKAGHQIRLKLCDRFDDMTIDEEAELSAL